MLTENQGGAGGVTAARRYRLLYWLGIIPWDQETVPAELVALVEGPQALPRGRALDLGCGTGLHAVYLAGHGWQVTGVDYVEGALQRARSRAAAAGVAPRWVRGDVTRLAELSLGDGYTLLLDSGCYHGLSEAERATYAAGLPAVAAPGAILLLLSFARRFRGPAPRGADREEITRRFSEAWKLLWSRPAAEVRVPRILRNADPIWYCLRRR